MTSFGPRSLANLLTEANKQAYVRVTLALFEAKIISTLRSVKLRNVSTDLIARDWLTSTPLDRLKTVGKRNTICKHVHLVAMKHDNYPPDMNIEEIQRALASIEDKDPRDDDFDEDSEAVDAAEVEDNPPTPASSASGCSANTIRRNPQLIYEDDPPTPMSSVSGCSSNRKKRNPQPLHPAVEEYMKARAQYMSTNREDPPDLLWLKSLLPDIVAMDPIEKLEFKQEAANLLLSWGAPVDSRDVDLRTPLIHAAAEGHVGLVEFFIQKGTNVNCGDAEGQTALTLAAAKGRLSVTQWLVRSKAEVDVADHQGRTPLLHALENGKHAIVEFLLSNGATVECCDVSGFRPIDRAVEKGDLRMIELLLKKKGTLLKSTTWKLAEGKNDIIGLLLSKLLNDGRVLLKKGRLEESERRFRYALARMPTDTEDDESDEANLFRSTHVALLLQLAKVKEKMNDIEAAVKLLRDALELQPTNASVVKLLSSLNQREGGEGSSVTSSASRDQPLQSKEGATTQATARDGECPRLEVER
ncbi:unnamed protein product [Cyprideis torosa]|uniref:Uncharacterized protein n=1 Tax=Cyprideis torosa TaxID=163714 RepID=A0A7R8ZIX8_9CRUS|nr:unnamed protein product [Cyprideis torosa]CAG0887288.1 unnamed protein product [Cyprideis torosa]